MSDTEIGLRDRLFAPAILSRIEPSEEALMVARHLGDRPGIFVEVGANDPVHFSQSWQLERRGWSGLLVEPLSEQAAKLRAHRTAKVAEVACGSPAQHGSVLEMQVCGLRSTLVSGFIEPEFSPSELRRVPVVTLDSLLAQAGLDRVDFISIDVEGAEIAVLEGFSLDRYRPSLILIEDFMSNTLRHHYLTQRGYRFVRRTGMNSWYVPRDLEFPVSLFGRWQLFRKNIGTPLRGIKHRQRRRAQERAVRNKRAS